MTQTEKAKIVVKVLRKRFPALTNLEATHVAYLVVEALERAESEDKLNEPA